MMEKRIRLRAVDDVCEFVRAAEKCDFDVGVFCDIPESDSPAAKAPDERAQVFVPPGRSYNRMVVDAKSILGVMSMDLTGELTVKYGAQDGAFEKVLRKFAVFGEVMRIFAVM